jgi:hypothetical protein
MVAMTDIQLLILGVALGAIPSSDLGRLAVAVLSKKFGVSPKDIRKFNAATSESD